MTTTTPTTYDVVQLVGGPFAGTRLKVRRGTVLTLATRPKRRPGDRPPVATYTGNSTTGTLTYTGTHGATP